MVEEPAAPAPVVAAVQEAAAPAAAPIGFHNRRAVRIALVVSTLSFFAVALVSFLAPLLLPAAGFFSAWFYQRRSAQQLSVAGGARLGWITGLFAFVIATVLFTITVVGMTDPTLAAAMREQMKMRGLNEGNLDQMFQIMRTPSGIVQALITMFALFGTLPVLGGALGARFGGRRP